ncbi:WxL domain-containing protein [Apilactobacillus xinyiensis]|uniref:WxL domain-containing protein n=1 Tax=Apilactobacillus xinyiensis TaxID=2841032 RepID=UPI00200FFF3C|nr:WxL domain-containing protein [Apilactobacillus xinyiensis]MCL0330824.1 hypothetical protein [Apilactobacillus xinyiensis]
MSLINKKNIVTMFAGLALLSASGLGGVKALADGDNPSTPSTSKTQGDGNGAIGQIDNGGTASNNKSMEGTAITADGKGVSGKSDAHINVINGYLVLETVPSLGFEDVTGQEGNTKATSVKDNNTVLTTDSFYKGSQKPTELYVLDARSGLQGGYGYKVDAQLGNFGTYTNGTANPNTADAKLSNGDNVADKFNLNLSGRLDQQPGDNSSKVTDNVNLHSDSSNATVLTNSAKDKASGATKVSFGDNSNNGGGQTTLEVPEGIQAGQYAAPITWTLAPTASGNTANGGSTTNP